MIISHKHKFIFIKTAKTAGSSIEIALSKICGPKDVLTPLSDEEEKIRQSLGYRGAQNFIIPFRQYKLLDWLKLVYYKKRVRFIHHMSVPEIRWYLESSIWDNYFKFCFERNPWDKMISYYFWNKGEESHKSIEQFLLSGEGGDIRGFDLYSIGGIPVVDRVFLFEEMAQSLQEISVKLKLEEPLSLPAYKAKGSVRKDKRHYREILNKGEADIISKVFAREIKYFSYEF